jgi:hypothetical protein
LSGRRPVNTRAISSPQRRGIVATAAVEKYAACGVAMTLSMASSGLSRGTGSSSQTSSAAPASRRSRSARISARSSTTGPREVLMSSAVGFMRAKNFSPIRCRVSAFSSVWTET